MVAVINVARGRAGGASKASRVAVVQSVCSRCMVQRLASSDSRYDHRSCWPGMNIRAIALPQARPRHAGGYPLPVPGQSLAADARSEVIPPGRTGCLARYSSGCEHILIVLAALARLPSDCLLYGPSGSALANKLTYILCLFLIPANQSYTPVGLRAGGCARYYFEDVSFGEVHWRMRLAGQGVWSITYKI